MAGTNTLAYFGSNVIDEEKNVYKTGPGLDRKGLALK
jgi:hypothetical protein